MSHDFIQKSDSCHGGFSCKINAVLGSKQREIETVWNP
jgi:hypothetical protein